MINAPGGRQFGEENSLSISPIQEFTRIYELTLTTPSPPD
jgi:hypothetical protein